MKRFLLISVLCLSFAGLHAQTLPVRATTQALTSTTQVSAAVGTLRVLPVVPALPSVRVPLRLPDPVALPEVSASTKVVVPTLRLAEISPAELTRSLVVPHLFSFFPGKETIDGVIFDLDGTLIDSLYAWEHSGRNYLLSRGINPPAYLDEELASMSLLDGARLIKQMYNLPEEPEVLLAETLRPIRERYFKEIPVKPGVPHVLEALRAQGIKMAVATASDKELAEAALKRLGLLDYFEFIITCDEVGVGKRNPRVYEEALKRLGTQKARTLVAEDALYALKTAKQAGFKTVGIYEKRAAADQPEVKKWADYYIPTYQLCRVGKN